MFYNEQILQLFRHPKHAGEFPKDTPNLVSARVGNPGQTDVVQLQLLIHDGNIVDGKFKCSASVCTIASAEYVLKNIINQSIKTALSYNSNTIITALHLPENRISSALLVADCLQKVLKNE
jgi:NifU-like protein involved in Fe-S cluster formation